jgi:hypothetical protein
MAEPTHYWTGIRPHKRLLPHRWCAWETIAFGQAFTPSAAELKSFADKLRPIADGPPTPPAPPRTSPIGALAGGYGDLRRSRLQR